MPLDCELRNAALEFVDVDSLSSDEDVIAALSAIIPTPGQIGDTNRFTSVIADIGDERFILPLIGAIECGVPAKTLWLKDYMYALIELLGESEQDYHVGEDFAHLLGDWLLNTGGGEVSWKAGDLLSELQCPASREYLMKGALDASLFKLTRVSCLRGIVNQFRPDARALIKSLEDDSSDYVREACQSAMEHLERVEGE